MGKIEDFGFGKNIEFYVEVLKKIEPDKNPRYAKADDLANGELFAELFDNLARYNITAKCWYIYDGRIWVPDPGGTGVGFLAKTLAGALYSYAWLNQGVDSEYGKKIMKLRSYQARDRMIRDAKDFHPITNEMFDAHPYFLNCQNGILDLRDFKLIKHKSEYMLSKITNVYYDEKADSSDFEKFIDEIMLSNQEKIGYLQRILGYSLTDEAEQEEMYILYGETTRNGKSTLMEVISYMLGDYATSMEPDTIAKKQRDSRHASGDVARLKGCRFVHVGEPDKGLVLNAALIKRMTGNDEIVARNLFEREFAFKPNFKLFVNTNHLPVITDNTVFSSGRIKVISFDRHFEEDEQDPGLKDRLRTKRNLSGILNWCVAGLKAKNKGGLQPPECVKLSTRKYEHTSDQVRKFVEECMTRKSKINTAGKYAYEVYLQWCEENGFNTQSKADFFEDLRQKGLLSTTGTIDGKTVKNVIRDHEILGNYQMCISVQ